MVGGEGGWEARGGLNPPLGLFGLIMCLEVPAIGPGMLRWHKRSPYHWGEFQTHTFHPPWVPLSQVMNLQGHKNWL